MALVDAEQIQALFPRWEIVKYLNAKVPWPYPPDGALQYIRNAALPAMERGDEWHWTLRLHDAPDTIIGAIGLMKGEEENRGFWLAPEHRGRGLMSEACAWTADFYFDVLGFARMRVPKAVANRASRRISERMGMHLLATGGARLRLRSPAQRGMGDRGGGVAGVEGRASRCEPLILACLGL